MGTQRTLERYLVRVRAEEEEERSAEPTMEWKNAERMVSEIHNATHASVLKSALERGAKFEELGREIAAIHRDETPAQVRPYLKDWRELGKDAGNDLSHASWTTPHQDTFPFWTVDVWAAVSKWADRVTLYVNWSCPKDKGISECVLSGELKEKVKEISEMVKEATGKKCTWLLGVKEPYNVTSAINDVTSCFHRALEALQEHYQKDVAPGEFEVKGKCVIKKGSNPAAAAACVTWSDAVEERTKKAMTMGDYGHLAGLVKDGEVEIKVGAASGHAAHLSLNSGRLEYYDKDSPVNRVFKALLERYAGLRCRIEKERKWNTDIGVICEGLNEGNIGTAAKIMAAATSMDFRIAEWGDVLEENERHKFWPKDIVSRCKKEAEKWKVKGGLKTPKEGAELCAVVRALGLE